MFRKNNNCASLSYWIIPYTHDSNMISRICSPFSQYSVLWRMWAIFIVARFVQFCAWLDKTSIFSIHSQAEIPENITSYKEEASILNPVVGINRVKCTCEEVICTTVLGKTDNDLRWHFQGCHRVIGMVLICCGRGCWNWWMCVS